MLQRAAAVEDASGTPIGTLCGTTIGTLPNGEFQLMQNVTNTGIMMVCSPIDGVMDAPRPANFAVNWSPIWWRHGILVPVLYWELVQNFASDDMYVQEVLKD